MIGILIVTHGHFSDSLLESASMFVSDTTTLVRTIAFLPGQGVEDLTASVRTALRDLSRSDGILALVDLPGGSPARAVGALLSETERLELVSGVNLPMIVEVLMLRETMTLSELAEYALTSGTEGIVDVGKLLRSRGGGL